MKRILPILFCLYTTVIPATEAVNIVTVGAKGDGKTDNTQIIQRAIDESFGTTGASIYSSRNFCYRSPASEIQYLFIS